jgi:hypothetical protein
MMKEPEKRNTTNWKEMKKVIQNEEIYCVNIHKQLTDSEPWSRSFSMEQQSFRREA